MSLARACLRGFHLSLSLDSLPITGPTQRAFSIIQAPVFPCLRDISDAAERGAPSCPKVALLCVVLCVHALCPLCTQAPSRRNLPLSQGSQSHDLVCPVHGGYHTLVIDFLGTTAAMGSSKEKSEMSCEGNGSGDTWYHLKIWSPGERRGLMETT